MCGSFVKFISDSHGLAEGWHPLSDGVLGPSHAALGSEAESAATVRHKLSRVCMLASIRLRSDPHCFQNHCFQNSGVSAAHSVRVHRGPRAEPRGSARLRARAAAEHDHEEPPELSQSSFGWGRSRPSFREG